MHTITYLTPTDWHYLMPIITMCASSLLALLFSAQKGRLHTLSFVFLAIGSLIALRQIYFCHGAHSIMNGLLQFDPLSQRFSTIILIALIGSAALSWDAVRRERLLNENFALLGFAAVGMMLMVSTRDLFMLYVGLEISSLSIYCLVGSSRHKPASAEAALKYFILGGAASAFFLFGTSLYYGATGSTAFSGFGALWENIQADDLPLLPRFAILFLLAGFLFKLGSFPLHFWIPDVYTGAPISVSAFMISGVKAAAVGALLRFATEILGTHRLLTGVFGHVLALGVLGSLLIGAFLGLKQSSVKRLLAYSTIVHSGFILLGIFGGALATSIRVLDVVSSYALFYVVMNLAAFAVISILAKPDTDDLQLSEIAGLAKSRPELAFMFAVAMISMAGLPQTAGFVAKFQVLALGIAHGHAVLAAIALAANVLAIVYYLRPIYHMYALPTPEGAEYEKGMPLALLVGAVTAVFVLVLGIFPLWV